MQPAKNCFAITVEFHTTNYTGLKIEDSRHLPIGYLITDHMLCLQEARSSISTHNTNFRHTMALWKWWSETIPAQNILGCSALSWKNVNYISKKRNKVENGQKIRLFCIKIKYSTYGYVPLLFMLFEDLKSMYQNIYFRNSQILKVVSQTNYYITLA